MNATPIDPLPFLVQVGLDPNNPGMPQQVTGSPAGLSGTDPVRMVTYNVHYGRNPAAVGAEIRTVITRSQASIICLQEASVAARTTPPPGWQLIQPRVANERGNRVPPATPLLVDTRVGNSPAPGWCRSPATPAWGRPAPARRSGCRRDPRPRAPDRPARPPHRQAAPTSPPANTSPRPEPSCGAPRPPPSPPPSPDYPHPAWSAGTSTPTRARRGSTRSPGSPK